MKPGIHYDISNNDYHAETEWLGSTQLKALLPEEYKVGGSQEALDFGTLVHTVVLEPDNIAGLVALDAEKIGVKADGTVAQNPTMTAAWKRAVAEVEQGGSTVVAQSDLDRALYMRDSLLAHDTASELLFSDDGRSEVTAFAVDETGVQHKARFDRLIPGTVVDLKTTASKPGAHSLTRAVLDYGYDLSAAHYLAVAELLGIETGGRFTLVFVGKEPPYRVSVCDLDDMFIERGRNLRELALERAHQRTEPYPGATGRYTLACPVWALPYEEIVI